MQTVIIIIVLLLFLHIVVQVVLGLRPFKAALVQLQLGLGCLMARARRR